MSPTPHHASSLREKCAPTARSGQGDTHPWGAAPLLSIHSAGACPWSSLTLSGLSRMASNMLFITCLNQEGTGFVGFEKQTYLWVCFCFIGHTDLNTSNADFWITLENSYAQEMERIWWLPQYTYPLHKTCVTGRVQQGQKIKGPGKRAQFPLVCKNGGQTKSSGGPFQVPWTWLQLTRKSRKR